MGQGRRGAKNRQLQGGGGGGSDNAVSSRWTPDEARAGARALLVRAALPLLRAKEKQRSRCGSSDGNGDGDGNGGSGGSGSAAAEGTTATAAELVDDWKRDLGRVGMQLGRTKVFFRQAAYDALESQRAAAAARAAVRLQAFCRASPARRDGASKRSGRSAGDVPGRTPSLNWTRSCGRRRSCTTTGR